MFMHTRTFNTLNMLLCLDWG